MHGTLLTQPTDAAPPAGQVTMAARPSTPTDQHLLDIAFHTRQLAVSMLAHPVRVERAKALVELILDDAQTSQSSYSERLLASVLVDVLLVMGDRDGARELCNRIDLCTGNQPAEALIAARGEVAIAVDDLQSGLISDVTGVIELISRLEVLAADTSGDQLERARAALMIGRGWALVGRGRSAAAWLESAALLFERSSQPQWSRLTRTEATTIHNVGVLTGGRVSPTDDTRIPQPAPRPVERPQMRTTDNWQEGLTPAERRVALLIGGGRSNREAAAELYVSVKTVESHVQSVFRKLGMHRRSELANLVGRTADGAGLFAVARSA